MGLLQSNQGLERIVSRVRTHQDLLFGQGGCVGDHPLDKGDKPLLAMLASWPEFDLQAPAFQPEIGGIGA